MPRQPPSPGPGYSRRARGSPYTSRRSSGSRRVASGRSADRGRLPFDSAGNPSAPSSRTSRLGYRKGRAHHAYRHLLHLPSPGMRHRDVLDSTSAPRCSRCPTSTTSARSSSSTSRPARSGPTCSRRSRSPCAATTCAPRGCSATWTSTSCSLQHEFGIFGGRRRRLRAVVRARARAAAGRHAAHAAVGAERAPARGAERALRARRARDRDDRDGAAPPDRARRLRRRQDPGRAARGAGRAGPPARRARRRGRARATSRRCPAATSGSRQRFLLSTFGLLSPGKGIETMLDAMPAIVERHPEALYLIAGRTHPQVARRDGEAYRLQLERKVVALGLEDHVDFDDRFLSIDELADLLAVTDVFVTPYRNKEQIASGALTFAIAAGCAVVSTPYWYAEDLLSSGAGRLVPVRRRGRPRRRGLRASSTHPEALAAARAEARRVGAELAWSAVGASTADVLAEAAALVASAGASRRRSTSTCQGPHGPPAHAGGRRRDHPARARRDPEPQHRLLRRRRRAAGGRRARPRAPRRRPRWTPVLHRALAFLVRRDRCRRRVACATSWATTAAGSTSRTSATTSAARCEPSARCSPPPGCRGSSVPAGGCSRSLVALAGARGLAAHRGVREHRPRARSTPTGWRRGARDLLRAFVDQLMDAYRLVRGRRLALVRGPADATTTPAFRTR